MSSVCEIGARRHLKIGLSWGEPHGAIAISRSRGLYRHAFVQEIRDNPIQSAPDRVVTRTRFRRRLIGTLSTALGFALGDGGVQNDASAG